VDADRACSDGGGGENKYYNGKHTIAVDRYYKINYLLICDI